MNTLHNVGKQVSSFELYDQLDPITGITLLVDGEDAYFAGDETGTVLEVYCPYGTQEMANTLLSQLQGQVYAGFRAQNAVLSPAAELGDWVTVNGGTYMLAYRSINFGPGHMAEIAAPGESTQEHEYGWTSPETRKYKYNQTRSLISKTNKEIELAIYGEDGKGGLAGNLATFKVSLDGLASQIKSYKQSVDSNTEATAEYKAEVDGFRAKMTEYTEAVDSYTTKTAEFQATLDGYSGELSRYSDEVQGYTEQNAKYTAALEGFDATLKQYGEDVNGYTEKVGEYTMKLDEYSGNLREYTETVDGYTDRVISFQGTVDGFKQKVELYEEDLNTYSRQYSAIEQTVGKISMEVHGSDGSGGLAGKYASISTMLDNIKLEVSDGTEDGTVSIQLKSGDQTLGTAGTIDIKGHIVISDGSISFDSLDEEAQERIEAAAAAAEDAAESAAAAKTALGQVTVYSGGKTYINESMIRSGKVAAGSLYGGEVGLLDGNGTKRGTITLTEADTDNYAVDISSTGAMRLKATGTYAALWMQAGSSGNSLAIKTLDDESGYHVVSGCRFVTAEESPTESGDAWVGTYARQWYGGYFKKLFVNGSAVTSDRNKKHDIAYNLDKYDALFDRFRPASYRLNDEPDRIATGLIWQDVEDAVNQCGLTEQDFAALVRRTNEDGSESYYLNYTEFIALLIDQVQKLKARVAELEERL